MYIYIVEGSEDGLIDVLTSFTIAEQRAHGYFNGDPYTMERRNDPGYLKQWTFSGTNDRTTCTITQWKV